MPYLKQKAFIKKLRPNPWIFISVKVASVVNRVHPRR